LYRKVLLNLQLATYYVIPIAVAFVKTVVGVLAYGALSHRRNRLRWKIRRYDAPPAKQVLDSDLRPPFVLLRSFVDDSLEVKGQTVDQFTFEEVLTRQLSRLGPVIAIGRPGEKLPQSGAAREYLADDVWQNRVSELLEQAQCVVFIIHKTEGLRWEGARITELGGRKKTLFIIPPVNHAEVTKRWHGLMDGDKPSQQVSLALPKKTLVVFLPAPGFEVAIRGIRNESTVDDYDLAIWLGAKLIDTWANARVE